MPGATLTERAGARRRLPPEVRQEQVLDAALRLIGEGGPRAFSIEGVAREAGVSKTVVYNAFGTLDRMALALLDREEKRGLAALADAAPSLGGDEDPSVVFLEWAVALAETVNRDSVSWKLMLMPPAGVPDVVIARIQRGRDLAIAQMTSVLSLLLPPGTGLDADLAARSIVAAAEEHGRLMLSRPADYSPERIKAFVAALLRLIRPTVR